MIDLRNKNLNDNLEIFNFQLLVEFPNKGYFPQIFQINEYKFLKLQSINIKIEAKRIDLNFLNDLNILLNGSE